MHMLLLPRASHKISPHLASTADFQPLSLWVFEASITCVFSWVYGMSLHCREMGCVVQRFRLSCVGCS